MTCGVGLSRMEVIGGLLSWMLVTLDGTWTLPFGVGLLPWLLGFVLLLLGWAAFVRVVWSRRQSLANPGAVPSLLDGPIGCDPPFCVVWFRFRVLRRFLAYRPGEVARVYRLSDHVAAPGHGPAHLLVESAAEIGFVWSPEMVGWVREELPVVSNLASLIQLFKAAVLEGWIGKVSADLCAGRSFRGSPWLDIDGIFAAL